MTHAELNAMSILSLAHVGDAIYKLLVQTRIAEEGQTRVVDLHRATVAFVRAPAQARAAALILPELSEAERSVYRRGRNSHVNSVPHAASKAEYHAATGLEAVFGWLWLAGESGRIRELFEKIAADAGI